MAQQGGNPILDHPSQTWTVEFDLTVEEWAEGLALTRQTLPTSDQRFEQVIGWLALLGAASLAALVTLPLMIWVGANLLWLTGVAALAGGIAWLMLGQAWSGRAARNNAQVLATRYFESGQTWHIDGSGLQISSQHADLRLHWSGVEHLLESPQTIAVTIAGMVFVLPKRTFASEQEVAMVQVHMAQWFTASRGPGVPNAPPPKQTDPSKPPA